MDNKRYKLIVYYLDDTDHHEHYDEFWLLSNESDMNDLLYTYGKGENVTFYCNDDPEFENRYIGINQNVIKSVVFFEDNEE
jgi:hypothetical protein